MKEIKEIHDALSRLSCIGRTRFYFDPAGQVIGDGEIHYLVEVTGRFFVAWRDNDTRMMIMNPITRFSLDELEELGSEKAWMVLHMPTALPEGIQFREIGDAELVDAYRWTEARPLHDIDSSSCRYLEIDLPLQAG
jgi:hypothetical protein